MTIKTDLVREQQPFLKNTSFLNKGKVKFLQIKRDTKRQKCFQKNGIDSVSAYIHMRRDTPSPCTQPYTF